MHFGAGLAERLALLLGHDRADMVGALAEQIGGLGEDRAALLDFGRAPDRPGAVGGGERLVDVGLGREGQVGDAAAGRGVDDGVGVAAFAAFPHAIDEEFQVCVVAHFIASSPLALARQAPHR